MRQLLLQELTLRNRESSNHMRLAIAYYIITYKIKYILCYYYKLKSIVYSSSFYFCLYLTLFNNQSLSLLILDYQDTLSKPSCLLYYSIVGKKANSKINSNYNNLYQNYYNSIDNSFINSELYRLTKIFKKSVAKIYLEQRDRLYNIEKNSLQTRLETINSS